LPHSSKLDSFLNAELLYRLRIKANALDRDGEGNLFIQEAASSKRSTTSVPVAAIMGRLQLESRKRLFRCRWPYRQRVQCKRGAGVPKGTNIDRVKHRLLI